jgi:hypothetical protein
LNPFPQEKTPIIKIGAIATPVVLHHTKGYDAHLNLTDERAIVVPFESFFAKNSKPACFPGVFSDFL